MVGEHVAMIEDERDWQRWREKFDRVSTYKGDWQGVPVLLPELHVALHDRHPLRDKYRPAEDEWINILVGGAAEVPDDEEVVNHWVNRRLNYEVFVLRGNGRYYALKAPLSPDQSMSRLTYWLRTIGASDAWDLDAEYRAREKLRGLLSDRQWRHYELTGSFLETSPRSKLTYVFRRLRPTLVLSPRTRQDPGGVDDSHSMRCLAVLCMHPVGYYQETWGGCMVPSDDVIAHLLHMRADEANYWKIANQHAPSSPEAGL